MKKGGRLHMRLEEDLLDQVKVIAKNRGVTVTHLIDQYLRDLVDQATRPRADEDLGIEQA